jgi:tripartite-type tricarboxylate transporter receptor subunit TctC
MTPPRSWTLSKRLTALVCLAVLSFAAQAYPDKPITLVVPNPAGGAADNLARGFAEEMGKRLKQTVVVEETWAVRRVRWRAKVLRSAPDGYP